MRKLLPLIALAACAAPPSSTPLSKLQPVFGDTTLEVVAKGPLDILLHVPKGSDGSCPMLGADVTARFDGQAMHVFRGGEDSQADGCYPIAFEFDRMPVSSIAAWELTTSGSQLEIADRSAVWEVAAHPLFANNFVDDPAASQIVWKDVTQITTASVSPIVPVHIVGNAITYPPGTQMTYVQAIAHPAVERCDGPSACTVNLQGERQLVPINP